MYSTSRRLPEVSREIYSKLECLGNPINPWPETLIWYWRVLQMPSSLTGIRSDNLRVNRMTRTDCYLDLTFH